VSQDGRGERYNWTVLINTTIGTLMATIDSSIVLISLPAIFRGISEPEVAAALARSPEMALEDDA
jgi:hypothetical protein